MTSATFNNIQYETDGGKARITLNRPDKRNALSIELVEEMRDALWEADNDKSVHCIILSGAGPSFCAGYDIRQTGSATSTLSCSASTSARSTLAWN